jgi:glycosyltransferase involved in cell wall biosynthesis
MHAPFPTVSIVITCYNYEKYVGHAIASAVAQTHAAHEIIVVNDGSTDGSESVIRRFPEVTYIFQQNSGQVAGFNRAFTMSTGEVVIFLDADDVMEPRAIEQVVKHWKADCAKLQYELTAIDADGDSMGRHVCNYPDGYDEQAVRDEFSRYGTYLWPVCSGNAYARWFLEKLLPMSVKSAPDGYLNTLAPMFGPVVVVDRPLARYRLHTENQSYHGTEKNRLDIRFAKQIDLRISEFVALRAHAMRLGVKLPESNLLDTELVFINYRLMVKKLGGRYTEDQLDSVFSLWRKAVRLLAARPFRWSTRLVNLAWLTAMLLSPRSIAHALISLRFSRAEYLKKLRRLSPLSHA